MKKIVISGINLVSGGTLSVFKDCLLSLKPYKTKYNIIVLVHKKELFREYLGDFTFYEFPLSKKSWVMRCFYEYIYFYFFSIKINSYLWLSLHDITPWVKTKKLAVYCHNPAPFYKISKEEIFLDLKFTLFTFFYKFLYLLNIKNNNYVIVQQNWIKERFQKMYKLHNVIVAHPKISSQKFDIKKTRPGTFIYPTYPRVFKNIETLCEAIRLIDNIGIKVYITIDGSENLYSAKIVKKYKHLKSIDFIGIQDRSIIFRYYEEVEALIFPSKLETWGLPMSEFAQTGKPIFASDLEFAHETLENYSKTIYFDPNDPEKLANLLFKFKNKDKKVVTSKNESKNTVIKNWSMLLELLIKE